MYWYFIEEIKSARIGIGIVLVYKSLQYPTLYPNPQVRNFVHINISCCIDPKLPHCLCENCQRTELTGLHFFACLSLKAHIKQIVSYDPILFSQKMSARKIHLAPIFYIAGKQTLNNQILLGKFELTFET